MQEENSQKSLFSARLLSLMADREMNQITLANLSGVNQSGISKYVRGDSTPRAGELARMAMALGVTMDYLWGSNNDNCSVKNDWRERAECLKNFSVQCGFIRRLGVPYETPRIFLMLLLSITGISFFLKVFS